MPVFHHPIQVSGNFKSNVVKSVMAIILFLTVYFIFAAASLLLTAFCVWLAITILQETVNFGTLLVSIGIVGMGMLISVFLFKFIFSSKKVDRSELIEIDIDNEPELKAMIGDIVEKVQTQFPKRVYLSHEVNAAVFYDSTFWSMFLPIKKNLLIGVGLINIVTQEELKAILAHEFGHFSQRSMKVSSYVYNVNKIIYDMLYQNESYNNLISKWSGIHLVLSIMVWVVLQVVKCMQWVLSLIYKLINSSYSALSREMEFHADEIAANVTGSHPLTTSLLRLNLANYSLEAVLALYQREIANNLKSKNVYLEQKWVMDFYAAKDNVPFKNDFPLVTVEFLDKFNKSKLVIKDQWASHPATEDRVARLKQLDIQTTDSLTEPANLLLQDIAVYQQEFSNRYFAEVVYKEEAQALNIETFKSKFTAHYDKNTFDKKYNGYYDNKNFVAFELDEIPDKAYKNWEWGNTFSNEMVNNVYVQNALASDIHTLKMIAEKKYIVKLFDYDGIKYKRKNSTPLILKLEKELEVLNNIIRQNDLYIYHYFLSLEQAQGRTPVLTNMYRDFFEFDRNFDVMHQVYSDIHNQLEFIRYNTEIDVIIQNFKQLSSKEELLKVNIRKLLLSPIVQAELSDDLKESFTKYQDNQLDYFWNQQYKNDNLNILFTILEDYNYLLNRYYFLHKKEILDYQMELQKIYEGGL